ncbi:MAG: 30S ribosomal protein S12 methylthiotransferase RimO [Candidatus Krumholzibacteriota bacterium]|nr:30S ribosomal protein S12 methylthiotransferase RimO [Candidatus Krumholzibacteriota bacterium]
MKNTKESEITSHPKSYYFFNLGCPKNLVDAEVTAAGLEAHGWIEASDPGEAGLLVITTCAFISIAEEESVNEILRVAALKKDEQILAVLGCLVSREAGKLEKLIPEVDIFLPVNKMESLHEAAGRYSGEGSSSGYGAGSKVITSAGRRLFTPSHLAYLKIAEGCSNHCSYCMIPSIRGELESRDPVPVISEARALATAGVKELVVIAQDTTAYGMDFGKKGGLYKLLEEISGSQGPEWIRLMYMHPAHIDAVKISRLAAEGVIIPYLDLPIQHASDKVLARMKRGYDKKHLEKVIGILRSNDPGMVLRTTVMTGFPGETEEDFQELIDFLERYRFDHVGVFTYSPETGTKASSLAPALPEKTARARADEVSALQMDISYERLSLREGRKLKILVDEILQEEQVPLPGVWGTGRFYGQAHEIDGVTYLSGRRVEPGSFAEAIVTEAEAYDLFASIK